MASHVEIAVPANFDLCQAVCSYGFFIQAPNVWNHQAQEFSRPLLGFDDSTVDVVLRLIIDKAEAGMTLQAEVAEASCTLPDALIIAQITRMLRLNKEEQQHVAQYQKLDAKAKQEGFGALFRSPTVWEDLVKSILLCNCGWGRTLAMNRALCSNIGSGAFPQPKDIVTAGMVRLQSECGLGYRAKSLLLLADQVIKGEINLDKLDEASMPEEELYALLLSLPGVGPFTAANMMQLLGHYRRIPCDSETVRHLRKAHGLHQCTQANVQQHADQVYAKYAPYQFLAYWRELWRDYEQLVGPFHLLPPDAYHLLTGHNMRKRAIPGRTATTAIAAGAISNQIGLPANKVQPSNLQQSAAPTSAQTRSQTKTAAQTHNTSQVAEQTPEPAQASQLQDDSTPDAPNQGQRHEQEAQHAVGPAGTQHAQQEAQHAQQEAQHTLAPAGAQHAQQELQHAQQQPQRALAPAGAQHAQQEQHHCLDSKQGEVQNLADMHSQAPQPWQHQQQQTLAPLLQQNNAKFDMLGSLQPQSSTQPQAVMPEGTQVALTHMDSSLQQTEAFLAAATSPEKAAVQASQPDDKRRRAATEQQTKRTYRRGGKRKVTN